MATKKTTDTTTKKKGVNGKAKGSTFESKVAKTLTAALPLTFIRSPGSGARVGGQNFEKFGAMFGADAMKLFVADVVPTNERESGYNFLWSVECKFYANVDTFVHLFNGTSKIFSWFEESVVDSAKVGKKPMLIFKWNRTDTFVAIEEKDAPNIDPSLKLQPKSGRHLFLYNFDELLTMPNFWVEEI